MPRLRLLIRIFGFIGRRLLGFRFELLGAENLPRGGRLAVLFGSEKTGLRNRDLQHCHALLRIPTRPGPASSMMAT